MGRGGEAGLAKLEELVDAHETVEGKADPFCPMPAVAALLVLMMLLPMPILPSPT